MWCKLIFTKTFVCKMCCKKINSFKNKVVNNVFFAALFMIRNKTAAHRTTTFYKKEMHGIFDFCLPFATIYAREFKLLQKKFSCCIKISMNKFIKFSLLVKQRQRDMACICSTHNFNRVSSFFVKEVFWFDRNKCGCFHKKNI